MLRFISVENNVTLLSFQEQNKLLKVSLEFLFYGNGRGAALPHRSGIGGSDLCWYLTLFLDVSLKNARVWAVGGSRLVVITGGLWSIEIL